MKRILLKVFIKCLRHGYYYLEGSFFHFAGNTVKLLTLFWLGRRKSRLISSLYLATLSPGTPIMQYAIIEAGQPPPGQPTNRWAK
jgi:hypothetical protein